MLIHRQKNTHIIVFSMIFMLIKCVLVVCAAPASNIPFVIFQPGEFFDPFTEKSLKDHHSSESVTPQPVVLFGEANTIFSQPWWHLLTSTASNSYPRTIAQTSGSAKELGAQIRQPNNVGTQELVSFNTNPRTWGTQLKTATNRPKQVSELTTQPKREYVQLKATQGRHSQPRNLNIAEAQASPLIAEASRQTNKLIGQLSELVAHPSSHAASKSDGGGHNHDSGYRKSHSDKDVKDYKSDHHKDVKDFKKYDDHHKKAQNSEKGGHHNKHHDEAGHHKKYHEGKKSHKAAKFGEKKGHKRGHKTKGYHNKFHRDEYHREHRFYDDYNKEGYHEKHGDSHSQYKKKQGGHKKGGGRKSGHSSKKHGKKGYTDKGNVEEDHKGFDREGGRKKYHKHHKDYHKKQGSVKGKQYGYAEKH